MWTLPVGVYHDECAHSTAFCICACELLGNTHSLTCDICTNAAWCLESLPLGC
jgi:hypothetical protein